MRQFHVSLPGETDILRYGRAGAPGRCVTRVPGPNIWASHDGSLICYFCSRMRDHVQARASQARVWLYAQLGHPGIGHGSYGSDGARADMPHMREGGEGAPADAREEASAEAVRLIAQVRYSNISNQHGVCQLRSVMGWSTFAIPCHTRALQVAWSYLRSPCSPSL